MLRIPFSAFPFFRSFIHWPRQPVLHFQVFGRKLTRDLFALEQKMIAMVPSIWPKVDVSRPWSWYIGMDPYAADKGANLPTGAAPICPHTQRTAWWPLLQKLTEKPFSHSRKNWRTRRTLHRAVTNSTSTLWRRPVKTPQSSFLATFQALWLCYETKSCKSGMGRTGSTVQRITMVVLLVSMCMRGTYEQRP